MWSIGCGACYIVLHKCFIFFLFSRSFLFCLFNVPLVVFVSFFRSFCSTRQGVEYTLLLDTGFSEITNYYPFVEKEKRYFFLHFFLSVWQQSNNVRRVSFALDKCNRMAHVQNLARYVVNKFIPIWMQALFFCISHLFICEIMKKKKRSSFIMKSVNLNSTFTSMFFN